MSEIAIFETDHKQVEVRLDGETLWVMQAQMAELFDTSSDNISLHLKNIYSGGGLEERATTEDFSVVRQEGKRRIRRQLRHYNLDSIISVGYRVSSVRATRFRQWATQVLREHLTQGYTANEHRLAQRGLDELEQAVDLLGRILKRQLLVSDLGREVVGLIADYAKTWRLLLQYDEQGLSLSPGQVPRRGLPAEAACEAVAALKEQLMARGEASDLFGRERERDSLGAILGNLEQTNVRRVALQESRGARCPFIVFRHQGPPVLRWQ